MFTNTACQALCAMRTRSKPRGGPRQEPISLELAGNVSLSRLSRPGRAAVEPPSPGAMAGQQRGAPPALGAPASLERGPLGAAMPGSFRQGRSERPALPGRKDSGLARVVSACPRATESPRLVPLPQEWQDFNLAEVGYLSRPGCHDTYGLWHQCPQATPTPQPSLL